MRREFKKRARLFLIDDNFEHLNGIKDLLIMDGSFDIVGSSTSASVGIGMIKKSQPDVVLVDMNMPEKDGLETIKEIKALGLPTKTLVLSAYDSADLVFRAMKIGAKGYVLKTMASAQLIKAIEEVHAGKVYLPPHLTLKFFDHFQNAIIPDNVDDSGENLIQYLTQREDEVLNLLTKGITYKGVSNKLFISETTVKTHVNNIFQKLQVNDRTQAVLYAIAHGYPKNNAKVTVSQ